MLFNSYIFICVFLPVTLLGFYLIGARSHHRIAIAWLVAASLFFYAWWNPAYVSLILLSILFNYGYGLVIADTGRADSTRKLLLGFGVAANLGLLGYYKYANFFIDTVNAVAGTHMHLADIVLPLGISFFTFQQIAYLVDAYRGETREYNFLHYALFVTFFPQLIAGPIVHHREILPQFARALYRLKRSDLAVGISIFVIGLFKKVVLADGIAHHATPVYSTAINGGTLGMLEAWSGAMSYTFQIYFDFSGYSDMAIGLSRMFGIRLPANFNSPYKATSIIEHWRNWHITLSRFLREYVYIPLGGNRKGPVSHQINLATTMLLGGLWHGANWTFVIWGGLHATYLVVNHLWRIALERFGFGGPPTTAGRWAGRVLTFLCIVIGFVFFRTESLPAALSMLRSMIGLNGVLLPQDWQAAFAWLPAGAVQFGATPLFEWRKALPFLLLGFVIVWGLPNTQEIMRRARPVLERIRAPGGLQGAVRWRPNLGWALFVLALGLTALARMGEKSEFLYFQF